MKILITTILFSILTFKCFGQDIIIKTDQSTIESKIIEITESTVKYKRFSNLNGPTYNLNKDKIFIIRYQNGETETVSKTSHQNIETDQNFNQENLTQPDLSISSVDDKTQFDYLPKLTKNQVLTDDAEFALKKEDIMIWNKYKNGTEFIKTGNYFIRAGEIVGAGLSVYYLIDDGDDNWILPIASAGGGYLLGWVIKSIANSSRNKAIDKYNQRQDKYGITPSKNGLGIAINF